MSNVPKLRFPEFTGEWEEKKIREVAECKAGATPDTKNDAYWINGTIPWMSSGEVNNRFIFSTEKKITQLGYDKTSTQLLPSNTVVVALAGQGKTRGTVAITKIELCTNQSLCAILSNENLNSEYLFQFLSSQYKQLRMSSTGGDDSRGGLNLKIIGDYRLPYPSLPEQQKIADFLSNVDSIIAAETKILNSLQKKKKALMQKLFTQQLRFKQPDGTDFPAWEDKKLISEFPFIRNGFVGTVTDFFTTKNDGIKYIEGTNIHNGIISNSINLFVTKEFHKTHKNSQLKENDILMVQSGHVGETAVVPKELENSNCHALIIMSNGGNCSSAYVNYYFQSRDGKKQLSILTTGSTIKHILASDMQKFICPFPCLEEQQKIADCLSSMDSLIQNQQKVVTTWQQRKKALLQQMFI